MTAEIDPHVIKQLWAALGASALGLATWWLTRLLRRLNPPKDAEAKPDAPKVEMRGALMMDSAVGERFAGYVQSIATSAARMVEMAEEDRKERQEAEKERQKDEMDAMRRELADLKRRQP